MKLQRTVSCITGILIAVGFAASQAGAGSPGGCPLEIEINALRAPQQTVTANTTKNVTAKARIAKGSGVPAGTTLDTQLQIQAFDGAVLIHTSQLVPVTIGVGKGGKGAKIGIPISQCNTEMNFVATFSGVFGVDVCTGEKTLTKACK